jgi:hypothetical protein
MPLPEDPELTPAQETDQIRAFDPTTVPSNTAPGLPSEIPQTEEALPDDEHGEAEAQPLPQFDEKIRDPFSGLLYIGALKDTFDWGGHSFTIRTLKSGELADVALAIKKYADSDGALKAYQGAIAAAALLDIDGQGFPLPVPIRTDEADFERRFDYVMRNWFPPTLDAIYERYIELEITVRKVVEAMGNRSG